MTFIFSPGMGALLIYQTTGTATHTTRTIPGVVDRQHDATRGTIPAHFAACTDVLFVKQVNYVVREEPTPPACSGILTSINTVLKRIGYDGKGTGHGFRHTMSTILHEQGFNSAWIELQLAHVDKNSIRGTYNHAQYLDGRREMMQ